MNPANSLCRRLILMVPLLMACAPWTLRAERKDGGTFIYSNAAWPVGPAVFSHRFHGAKGVGYQCKNCHKETSGEPMAITMERIRRGEACGACHDGHTHGPRDRQAASPVEECSGCHAPATDTLIALNRMDAAVFSHTQHLGVTDKKNDSLRANFSCRDCHPDPFERNAAGTWLMGLPHVRGGCAQCHDGRKHQGDMPVAFAATTRCLTCHRPSIK